MYWPIGQIQQSFPVLLGWWIRENTKARNLWPGLITSRMTDERGVTEVLNQIMVSRGFLPDVSGQVHFSMKAFLRDSTSLRTTLENGPYRRGALVPPSPWLDNNPPLPPSVSTFAGSDSILIAWSHPLPSDVFRWVVYFRYGTSWEYEILVHADTQLWLPVEREHRLPTGTPATLPATERLMEIAVTAIDRTGNESSMHFIGVDRQTPPGAGR